MRIMHLTPVEYRGEPGSQLGTEVYTNELQRNKYKTRSAQYVLDRYVQPHIYALVHRVG